MPLLARTIATPIAIEVRAGAVDVLAPLLSDGRISSGGKVAIAIGPGHGQEIADRLASSLPHATVHVVAGGTLQAALELIAELREDFYDAVVGIGGGRTVDVAKYAATMSGLPFVAVATTLTHDGLASPVASLESHGRKASFGVHVPIAVIVDIDEVRGAPIEHIRSGVGDVLSNLSSIADWELAHRERGETMDGLSISMARTASEAILDLEPGTDRFLITLADALIMSGIAMTVAGSSRPCSGACHEISHALDAFHGSPGLHGTQVAFGARFATWLRGEDELLRVTDQLMRVHGLPRHPDELGISRDVFVDAVTRAPETRPDRYTVLEHLAPSPSRVEELVDAYLATLDR